jgi:hypothetical protein
LVECQLPKLDLQAEASSNSSGSSDVRDERDAESPVQVQTGCTSQVQSGPGDSLADERSRRSTHFSPNTSANLPIRRAAQRLARAPNDASAVAQLIQAIVAALSKSPGPRRPGRSISISKRIAALLNTYASGLSDSIRADLRARCEIKAEELGLPAELQRVSHSATMAEAALHLGLTARQLARRLADPQYRRDLGWPRPLGGDVIFARQVLDPRTAAAYLNSCPAHEPWPKKSWPEGWR